MAVSLYKDVKCKGYSSYYSYRADVKENSYDIVKNTSNVTIDFYMADTGSSAGFKNYQSCQFGIWVDGVKKGGGQSAATTVYGGSYVLIGSWTGDITHDTDGKKEITVGLTFRCSSSTYYSDAYLPLQNDGTTSYPSGTDLIWSMGKVALTTIPRASALSASDGTLGTEQTLTVTRYSTSFTHTITYKCGSASGTICTKSSSTSISFTPPIDLASQNTTGVKVSVALTIITYSGSTEIGRASKTITCAMPASVKPSCSLSITDAMGYADTYSGYIKGLSKFQVVVTTTESYGAAIKSCKTIANGASYAATNFTTEVIKTSGTLTISCTVTDSRGRTGTVSVDVTVLDYVAPSITSLSAVRCDSDGTANEQGEYVKATFSGAVTGLNDQNTATYTLKYKKSTETAFTSVELTAYSNNYAVDSGIYIFVADTGSSYDITLVLADAFGEIPKTADAPTGFALMHWKADGTALGIGKIAERSYSLDMGVAIEMNDHKIEGVGMPTASGDAVPLGFAQRTFAPHGLVEGYYNFASIDEVDAKILELTQAMAVRSVLHFVWKGTSATAVPSGVPYNDYYWLVKICKLHASNYAVVEMETYGSLYGYKSRNIMSNGVLGGWEWINPPMFPNTEYRTTERWQGEPLYTKLVNFGKLPSGTTKSVAVGVSDQQVKSIEAICMSGTSTLKIPSASVSIWVNYEKNLIFSVSSTTLTSYNAYVILKYTKD